MRIALPAALGLAVLGLLAAGFRSSPSRTAAAPAPDLVKLLAPCYAAGSDNAQALCLQRKILAAAEASGDPGGLLPRVDRYAHAVGGILGASCHILMHWVGRRYGQDEHVRLSDLMRLLPRSNDPGCSAGFTHGLLISLGPQVEQLGPRGAAATCARAATRYERYSCVHGLGHAYMRLFGDVLAPALDACDRLGPEDAVDCAQGAYHDYWLSVGGADATAAHPGATTSPRALCGAQPRADVRACWYRALLEAPDTRSIDSAKGILGACSGLAGIQRSGCVTGASLVASADPFEQMRFCAALSAPDARDCVRGVRAQALVGEGARQVALARGCAAYPGAAREACAAWLGKALAVVTNGRFGASGCPALPAQLAAPCRRGAAALNGPLETFS